MQISLIGIIEKELKTDFFGSLEKVAQIGYRGMEFGWTTIDTAPAPIPEIKRRMDDLGLKTVNLHIMPQALEADALHFSTDILSSLVVLAGLIFTRFGWMKADAIAALGVSIFVLAVSFRLAWRSLSALVDRVPADHVLLATAAAMSVPEVKRVYDVRVREAGDRHFIDLKVAFDPSVPFRIIHSLTMQWKSLSGANSAKPMSWFMRSPLKVPRSSDPNTLLLLQRL
jgi:hypothetical protein